MPPESGGMCGRLTYDLPLGCLQGGLRGLGGVRGVDGLYLRLIDSCITPLKAQGPSRTCNESKEEDGLGARDCDARYRLLLLDYPQAQNGVIQKSMSH